MSSESLTLQQLKDMKELARQMGAGSMGTAAVDGATTGLSVHAATATNYAQTADAWAHTTLYVAGTVVKHSGAFYKAKVEFTSGNEFNLVNWDDVTTTIESALALKADQSAMNTALAAKLDASPYLEVLSEIRKVDTTATTTLLSMPSLYIDDGHLGNPTDQGYAPRSYIYPINEAASPGNFQGGITGGSGSFPSIAVSLTTEECIVCRKAIYVYSDRRIKKNIEDVPDALALEQVRKIPCRYYEYKDQVKRGSEKTIGFIAQEVNEVLPMAVNRMTDFIPDHMKIAELSWEESELMTVSNLNEDVTTGTKIRFKCYTGTLPTFNEDGSVKTPSMNLRESTEDVVMMEGGKFKMKEKYDHVFIFGREVDDKLALDKNKIFSLHHAAIQELDKTVEVQKATIAALEQQNAAQQVAIDALMARVAALEGQ
jgi:hypothetical protein